MGEKVSRSPAPRCEMPELVQRLREVEAQLDRLRAIILHQPLPISDPFTNSTLHEEPENWR